MELIELISDINLNYIREASPEQVRSFLNRAYMKISNSDISNLLYYNSNDKKNPIPKIELNTSLHYEISPSTLLNSDNQYINSENPEIPPTTLKIDGVNVYPRKVKAVVIPNRKHYAFMPYEISGTISYSQSPETCYYQVPFTGTERRNSNSFPTIQFLKKYGLSEVYILFYFVPEPILNINSKIFIDIDKWYELLVDGTVGYYEDVVNGNSIRKLNFEQKLLKNYKAEMNENQNNYLPMRMPTVEF